MGTTAGDGGGSFVSCDQACADVGTGVTLANLINGLYNQSLAGRPVGSQSLSAPCPLGGTAMITGTTGYDATHDITTVNLIYAMAACHFSGNGAQLTADGTVTEVGSFDSTMLQSLNDASDSLTIVGTIDGADVNDSACMVHVNVDSNSTPEVSGTVCGRTF